MEAASGAGRGEVLVFSASRASCEKLCHAFQGKDDSARIEVFFVHACFASVYDRFHLKCHDCQKHKNQKTWKIIGLFLRFLAKLIWVDSKRDLLCSYFYFFMF